MENNVERFFALYNSDEALRRRIEQAEAAYPGSLEIRDAVAEAVLLPAARELGLEFSVQELRRYETRLKMERFRADMDAAPEDFDEELPPYWMLDRGWSYDNARFCGDEE